MNSSFDIDDYGDFLYHSTPLDELEERFSTPTPLSADEIESNRLADEALDARCDAEYEMETALATCDEEACANYPCPRRVMPGSFYCAGCR